MKIIAILIVLISLIIGVNMVSSVKADQQNNNNGTIKSHAAALTEAAANQQDKGVFKLPYLFFSNSFNY